MLASRKQKIQTNPNGFLQQNHLQKQQQQYAQTISRSSNLNHFQLLRGAQLKNAKSLTSNKWPLVPLNSNQYHPQASQLFHYSNEQAVHQLTLSMQQPPAFQEFATSAKHKEFSEQQQLQIQPISKPLCRCRVMYLGSSVPHITKNGLHGIQEPLKHLYPEEQFNQTKTHINLNGDPNNPNSLEQEQTIDISHLSSSLGIDSWLSVWSNGLLLENVDEFGREMKRFFSIDSLHYCAAVRFFDTNTLKMRENGQAKYNPQQEDQQQQQTSDQNNNTLDQQTNLNLKTSNPAEDQGAFNREAESNKNQGDAADRLVSKDRSNSRFLPLDAPLFQTAGMLDANHPPLFAAIMRRTTGIKVLECHAFICRRDAAANALVRCCTHAYSDFLSAQQLSFELNPLPTSVSSSVARASSTDRRQSSRSKNSELMVNYNNRGNYTIGPKSKHYNNNNKRQLSAASSSCCSTRAQLDEPIIATIHHSQITGSSKPFVSSSDSLKNHRSSTEENNSLGASSVDDNYAIIPKQHTHPTNGEAEEKLKIDRKKDGSSKSLFYDFQPHVKETSDGSCCCELEFTQNSLIENGTQKRSKKSKSNCPRHSREMEKLSHSLDLLKFKPQDGAICCAVNNSTRLEGCGDDEVQYSIVRNKRHSKSMQNLKQHGISSNSNQHYNNNNNNNNSDQLQYQIPSKSSGNRKRAASSKRESKQQRAHDSLSMSSRRRSYSYQNMLMPEEVCPTGPSTNPHSNPQLINNSGIEACCLVQENGSDPTRWKKSSMKSSSKTLGSRSRSRARKSEQHLNNLNSGLIIPPIDGLQLPPQALIPNVGSLSFPHNPPFYPNFPYLYPHPATYGANGYLNYPPSHHHQLLNVAAAAHYPSPGLLNQPAQIYATPPTTTTTATNNIYDSIHPRGYLSNGHAAQALASPQFHYTLSPSTALHHQQQFYSATTPTSKKSSSSSKKITSSKGGTVGASLASKFRCLSPPVNFIRESAPKRVAVAHVESRSPRPSGSGVVDLKESCKLAEGEQLEVVSAKPGFISHNTASSASPPYDPTISVEVASPTLSTSKLAGAAAANTTTTTTREKKLSWIKRLSLTMAPGGNSGGKTNSNPSSSGRQELAASAKVCLSELELEPEPKKADQKGERKKKSNSKLFSGSLTLGRRKQHPQEHPKLVTS